MLVPGILIPCHQPCTMAGSALIPLMCASGISSELLNAHSLSAPRTCNSRLSPEMDKTTMLLLPGHWDAPLAVAGTCLRLYSVQYPKAFQTMPRSRARLLESLEWQTIVERVVAWKNLPINGTDYCALWHTAEGWLLKGAVVGVLACQHPMLANYEVHCDENWLTQRVQVELTIGKETKTLNLSVEMGNPVMACSEFQYSFDLESTHRAEPKCCRTRKPDRSKLRRTTGMVATIPVRCRINSLHGVGFRA